MTISLLDPLLIAKLAPMELRARRVVEGALAGRHRAVRQGHSLEFSAHRPYTPSDEWRHIDWKIFAKTDRWMVREHQAETNLRATFLMDTSHSMSFHSADCLPKIQYASILLASLTYFLIHHRESVGLALFNNTLTQYIPARGGPAHLALIHDVLEKIDTSGETNLRGAIEQIGWHLPRRGLVFVVSDFLASSDDLFHSVRLLLSRKHDVIAFHLMDPAENNFPYEGDILFEDMETHDTIRAHMDDIQQTYRRIMAERLDKTQKTFHSLGVDYYLFDTQKPLDAALSHFLHRRMSYVN